MHWYALYTKSRHEKKAADRLAEAGFEVYCPMITTVRQWSDRKKKVTVPVFSSYIFVRVTEKQRYDVLQDQSVMNFVFWQGKPAVIRDQEMEDLKDFLYENEGEEVQVRDLQPGERVLIQRGPLHGHEGKVDRVEGKRIFVILEGLNVVVELKQRDL